MLLYTGISEDDTLAIYMCSGFLCMQVLWKLCDVHM